MDFLKRIVARKGKDPMAMPAMKDEKIGSHIVIKQPRVRMGHMEKHRERGEGSASPGMKRGGKVRKTGLGPRPKTKGPAMDAYMKKLRMCRK